MSNDTPKRRQSDVVDLRPELLEADDQKVRRVLAIVDELSDPAVNKALLDPLRPRLAALKPVRPLRFTRLLFMPIDPLTVPLRGWQPDQPAIPRPALAPIGRIVRAGLGGVANVIDTMIAGRKADATWAIAEAGALLWPQAAAILASAPAPPDWPDTGIALAAYEPLARSIAAILRRAVALRSLARDAELGALAPDEDIVDDVLADITAEPLGGCAMIARLLLLRSPQAASIVSRIVSAGGTREAKVTLRRAMDLGLEAVLSQMERESGFAHEVGNATLADVLYEVRRAITLIRVLEADQAFARLWPRVKIIRNRLDEVCRTRFARGMRQGLVEKLTAPSAAMDGGAQIELEDSARDLRKLEIAARKLGGAPIYDELLLQAAEAVRAAAQARMLTPMRELRLIELLLGADEAETLYGKTVALA